jgi:hypothetical protein
VDLSAARGKQRKRAMAVGICVVQSRADSNHNPRKDVTKDFLPSDMGELAPDLASIFLKVSFIARPQPHQVQLRQLQRTRSDRKSPRRLSDRAVHRPCGPQFHALRVSQTKL